MDPMGTLAGSEHVRPFYNWVLSGEQMRNQVRAARTNQTSSSGVCFFPFLKNLHALKIVLQIAGFVVPHCFFMEGKSENLPMKFFRPPKFLYYRLVLRVSIIFDYGKIYADYSPTTLIQFATAQETTL